MSKIFPIDSKRFAVKLAECKLSSSIQEQVIEVQGGERFRIEHSPPAPVEHSVQRCLLFRFTIVLAESHGSQSRWFGFLVSQREAAFVFQRTRDAARFLFLHLHFTVCPDCEHATTEEKERFTFFTGERNVSFGRVFSSTMRRGKRSIRFVLSYFPSRLVDSRR